MKKLFTILAIAACFAFIGCEKGPGCHCCEDGSCNIGDCDEGCHCDVSGGPDCHCPNCSCPGCIH